MTTEKRKPGRPQTNRGRQLGPRFTPEQFATIESAASQSGTTAAAWLARIGAARAAIETAHSDGWDWAQTSYHEAATSSGEWIEEGVARWLRECLAQREGASEALAVAGLLPKGLTEAETAEWCREYDRGFAEFLAEQG